jgi:hypothetical protein
MSDTNLTSFAVGNLDLSGIEEADLVNTRKTNPGYLTKAGKYTFNIIESKLSQSEKLKDGAGKQWGSIYLKAQEVETGRIMTGFVSVPVESLVYTSKAGNPSKVKTQIFCRFLESLIGKSIAKEDIAGQVADLHNLLDNGTISAAVDYTRDHVRFGGENANGDAEYIIRLANQTDMIDENGETLRFADRDSAEAYYTQLKGYKPSIGMDFVSFLPRAA